jgi:MFS family permease
MMREKSSLDRNITIAVLVAALGYFVDVYDLVLFSVVRIDSLKAIGITGEQLLSDGVYLLNCQMVGMLLGGIIWGILGDKIGRIQVLFGSILIYSIANLANAFVMTVPQYATLRFIAGLGLAGEIGAGITLVSELMSKEMRGYGTTLIATVGVSGALGAALVSDIFAWRSAYIVGGIMGLMLLVLRISVNESGLFREVRKNEKVARGDLRLLFSTKERIGRYACCILVGIPIWYVIGILVTFSPEIGKALGILEVLKPARSVLCYSIGITMGDLASGILSQYLKSRKKVILAFLTVTFALSMILLNSNGQSANFYYGMLIPIGFFIGYWAVFVTTAAEQFGTNLRATVATTAPNFVRGAIVPMTLAFNALKTKTGVVQSAEIVAVVCCVLAGAALYFLKETFASDLNFIERNQAKELPEQDLKKAQGW